MDTLFEHLTDKLILFGEWCYAKHSVAYDGLPDWFLGFDLYDRSAGGFLSCERRDGVLQALNVCRTPRLGRGRFTLAELEGLLEQSKFSDGPAEGLYLRVDRGDWLEQRAKLVRPSFVQTMEEHWARSEIQANRMK